MSQARALPQKSIVGRFVTGIPWKKILIGDLDKFDPFRWANLGIDIAFCAVGISFALLIALAAFALPHEARAVVWIGCIFFLYLAVDRPSWRKSGAGFPVLFVGITAGAVTLSAVAAGFSREWVLYLGLTEAVPYGVTLSFGIALAMGVLGWYVRSFNRIIFGSIDSAYQAKAKMIRRILKQALKLNVYPDTNWDDGTLVFIVGGRSAKRLTVAEVEQWLNRRVEFRPKQHWYQDHKLLVFPLKPTRGETDGQPSPLP